MLEGAGEVLLSMLQAQGVLGRSKRFCYFHPDQTRMLLNQRVRECKGHLKMGKLVLCHSSGGCGVLLCRCGGLLWVL